jgi:hypothetical protein
LTSPRDDRDWAGRSSSVGGRKRRRGLPRVYGAARRRARHDRRRTMGRPGPRRHPHSVSVRRHPRADDAPGRRRAGVASPRGGSPGTMDQADPTASLPPARGMTGVRRCCGSLVGERRQLPVWQLPTGTLVRREASAESAGRSRPIFRNAKIVSCAAGPASYVALRDCSALRARRTPDHTCDRIQIIRVEGDEPAPRRFRARAGTPMTVWRRHRLPGVGEIARDRHRDRPTCPS